MRLTQLFSEFFKSEKAGGLVLLFCTLLSLLLANSPFQEGYLHLWHAELAGESVEYWINDGLMVIFFLLIGLELKRELYSGELSNLKNAMLPVFSALGGMLVPALFYTLLNFGLPTQSGVGIPMATDIAFALGILSLLGNRVPASLKVLLVALAIIDDLGAILVIAVFYTTSLSWFDLGMALAIYTVLLLLNRFKVNLLMLYLLGGIAMWYFMLHSGIHATITGVLLAFAIPLGKDEQRSPAGRLQHFLHVPVAFLILPLFALANTAIVIGEGWIQDLGQPNSLGIFAGLILGKPLGIALFAWLAVRAGLCSLPKGLGWSPVWGMGALAGIGFTMSMFITFLAFDDPHHINGSKMAIILASLASGLIGSFWLRVVLRGKG